MPAIENIAVSPPLEGACVNFAAIFGRAAPVELEIGCGKGTFLLRQAKAHPDRDFFGIEWANKFYRHAIDRMARWDVGNVRVMRADAREFVMRHLPPACLSALHIYHPDPWPKKRHHKRRLIQTPFVDAAVRALRPGGRLAIQTDHAEYFSRIESVTVGRSDLLRVEFADANHGAAESGAGTNYEIKYAKQGRPIYRIAFVKPETRL